MSTSTPTLASSDKKKKMARSVGKMGSNHLKPLESLDEAAEGDGDDQASIGSRHRPAQSLPVNDMPQAEFEGISGFCRGELVMVTEHGAQPLWFVFDDFSLRACADRNQLDEVILDVNILSCKLSKLNDDTIIVERSHNRTFMLRASDEEERDTWFDVMRQCVHGGSWRARAPLADARDVYVAGRR